MSKQILDTGPAPDVNVFEVHGDLQVRGWDTVQMAVQADPEDVVIDQQDDQVEVRCHGDLDLHIPAAANLTLGSLHGDASIKFLQNGLEIAQVHGSLDLRQLSACRVDQVRGDLRVRSLTENLSVGHIDGDADARHIHGDCVFNLVGGDLDLQDIAGTIQASASGDARLRLNELTGDAYAIKAGGNLYCYLPEDAGLRIRMSSGGHVIKVRLPQGSTTYKQPDYELTLGDTAGSEDRLMLLSAGGTVYLFVETPGWNAPGSGSIGFDLPEDFGQQIARQVEAQISAQMSDVARRIDEQMEQLSERLNRAGFSAEETERIVEQARRTGETASARAQEKMRRAQEKLEQKLEAHRRRAEARSSAMGDRRSRRSSWTFEWPSPPTPPPPPAPPSKPAASEEERLMILRMLEQKKIDLEEADRLLSALEGDE